MTDPIPDYGAAAPSDERVAATNAELLEISELAALQVLREDELAAAELAVKTAKELLRTVREGLLPEAMAAAHTSDHTSDTGLRVRCKLEYYPSIPKATEAAAFAWLRGAGHGDLIKRALELTFGAGEGKLVEDVRVTLAAHGLLGHLNKDREAVHPQTLKAFVREQLEAGVALPEAIAVHSATVARVERKR